MRIFFSSPSSSNVTKFHKAICVSCGTRSQGLSSPPPLSLREQRAKEAEKKDPVNEVDFLLVIGSLSKGKKLFHGRRGRLSSLINSI